MKKRKKNWLDKKNPLTLDINMKSITHKYNKGNKTLVIGFCFMLFYILFYIFESI